MKPTIEELRALLLYNALTGEMRWRARGVPAWDARFAGAIAGTVTDKGYIQVSINDTPMAGHRVAWALFYGAWPDFEIDHRNLRRADNRIRNLRAARGHQNAANCGPRKRNKLGLKGVHAIGAQGFRAQIMWYGVKFNLGNFPTARAAHRAYATAARDMYGEFARSANEVAPRSGIEPLLPT